MSMPDEVGEGTVSGNQVSIPARIRRRLEIDDGDIIRWKVVDDELVVEVLHRSEETFDDFEPATSKEAVDTADEHDRFGIE